MHRNSQKSLQNWKIFQLNFIFLRATGLRNHHKDPRNLLKILKKKMASRSLDFMDFDEGATKISRLWTRPSKTYLLSIMK